MEDATVLTSSRLRRITIGRITLGVTKSNGLDDAKKLKAAVARVAKRVGVSLNAFNIILSDEGDFVNLKIILPAELFREDTPEATQVRDEFDDMIAGLAGIPSEDFEPVPDTTEDDW